MKLPKFYKASIIIFAVATFVSLAYFIRCCYLGSFPIGPLPTFLFVLIAFKFDIMTYMAIKEYIKLRKETP